VFLLTWVRTLFFAGAGMAPLQEQLVGPIPALLPLGLGDHLAVDLPMGFHAFLMIFIR